MDDWKERARALGWPESEISSCATLVKAHDTVTEVTEREVVIATSGVFRFEGINRHGVTVPSELPWKREWRFYRHEAAAAVIAKSDEPYEYHPPDLTQPPFAPPHAEEPMIEAVFTYCDCGPKHARSCTLYTAPPPKSGPLFYKHVRRRAAETIARIVARDARERQAYEMAQEKNGAKVAPRPARKPKSKPTGPLLPGLR